jgi:sortase A
LRYFELFAVIGLCVLIGYNGIALSRLNRQSTKVWILPTFTPVPLIQVVILPDGHTPPNATGGASPRGEEIPPHLLPLVQAVSNIPTPTTTPQHGDRIQIPGLHIDAPIIQGES